MVTRKPSFFAAFAGIDRLLPVTGACPYCELPAGSGDLIGNRRTPPVASAQARRPVGKCASGAEFFDDRRRAVTEIARSRSRGRSPPQCDVDDMNPTNGVRATRIWAGRAESADHKRRNVAGLDRTASWATSSTRGAASDGTVNAATLGGMLSKLAAETLAMRAVMSRSPLARRISSIQSWCGARSGATLRSAQDHRRMR